MLSISIIIAVVVGSVGGALLVLLVFFLWRRPTGGTVEGIVLRADNSNVVVGVPSTRRSSAGSTTEVAITEVETSPRTIDANLYEPQVVNRLSGADERRREEVRRRLDNQDPRTKYRFRADGQEHPLDGSFIALIACSFRKKRNNSQLATDEARTNIEGRSGASGGASAERSFNPTAVPAAESSPNRSQTDSSVLPTPSFSRAHGSGCSMKTCTVAENRGEASPEWHTDRDRAALESTTGINYMENTCSPYLPRPSNAVLEREHEEVEDSHESPQESPALCSGEEAVELQHCWEGEGC